MVGRQAVAQPHGQIQRLLVVHRFKCSLHAQQYTTTDREHLLLSDKLLGDERISVPGVIAGRVQLMSGQMVPVIWPELRCMYSWTTAALIKAVCGEQPPETATAQE